MGTPRITNVPESYDAATWRNIIRDVARQLALIVDNLTNLLGVRFLGVRTTTPLAPVQVGDGSVNNSADSQILISRSVDNTIAGNAHAFSDSSDINRQGVIGYNSYDARITFSGSYNYDHYAAFQFAPIVNASVGTFSNFYGFASTPTLNGGRVTNSYPFYAADPAGTGAITNNYGLYVAQLTRGDSNFAIYTAGSTPSYFGGPITANGDLTANGVLTANGNLTVSGQLSAVVGNTQNTSVFFHTSDFSTGVSGSGLLVITGAATGDTFTELRAFKTGNSAWSDLILQAGGRFVGIGTTAPKSKLHVTGLPVYANNAAAVAGGLTAGAFYRTGADPDPVCVVH